MKNALLILSLAAGLLLTGCDLRGETKKITEPDAQPRWSPQDFQQTLDSLSQVEPDSSASASSHAQALAKAQRARQTTPAKAFKEALGAFSKAQRPHVERIMSAARTGRSLQEIERAVQSATRQARSDLTGEELLPVLKVRALVLGGARHWAAKGHSFQGPSANDRTGCVPASGLRGGATQAAPDCTPAPMWNNYHNFWARIVQGFEYGLAGCGAAGSFGWYLAGPYGGVAGCGLIGLPAAGAGYYAEKNRQRDAYEQAVREWCKECRGEHWKNAQFCDKVLP